MQTRVGSRASANVHIKYQNVWGKCDRSDFHCGTGWFSLLPPLLADEKAQRVMATVTKRYRSLSPRRAERHCTGSRAECAITAEDHTGSYFLSAKSRNPEATLGAKSGQSMMFSSTEGSVFFCSFAPLCANHRDL